jgi:hypothetical protein
MKLNNATENWRELVNGWILVDDHDRPESAVDAIADELANDVLDAIFDEGMIWENDFRQSVGAFQIVQRATDAERKAFDDAVVAACTKLRIKYR